MTAVFMGGFCIDIFCWGNVRHIGKIAAFDSPRLAAALSETGIGVTLGYMTDDVFGFRPSNAQLAEAEATGVQCVTLPGVHDEFILHPQQVMAELDQQLAGA
jgi:hypothetical protein